MKRVSISILLATFLIGASAPSQPAGPKLMVERVVLLMRHGLRPPTKAKPMADGIANDPWPSWSVRPGYLTVHGAAAVELVGAYDRAVFKNALSPAGCPTKGAVAVYSDSDQRTIATGDAWIRGFAPGCGIVNEHKPENEADPLFDPIASGAVKFDPARADREVRARLGTGGIARLEAAHRAVLRRIDQIYCGPRPTGACGVSNVPARLVDPQPGSKPKMAGALDLGSTAGQILLLEYGDGKPLSEVGWGRATAADIAMASALHAVEYDVTARSPYVAAASSSLLVRKMLGVFYSAEQPVISVIVGHDSNVAALAGLLDLHWRVAGLAADDPAPGGAIGFEMLRDTNGQRFVRAIYRAQALDQLRNLTPLNNSRAGLTEIIPIRGCPATILRGGCRLADFKALINRRLAAGQY